MNENEPVLTANELLAYRRATGTLPEFPPPRAVIFAPQKSLASHVLRKHSTKQIKGFLGEFYLLKRTNGEIALSTGFGIGAPAIAGLADEFVSLGVKQFALIGMAGGLQPNLQTGSLVISTGAIRGEGVSRHYLPPAKTVESSVEMTQGISAILTKQNHSHSSGLTWTTDAPFRELRKDVLPKSRRPRSGYGSRRDACRCQIKWIARTDRIFDCRYPVQWDMEHVQGFASRSGWLDHFVRIYA